MDKILITGTGRCGTTFLIKLFSFLGFNTGFNRHNYTTYISPNCNSGMERTYNENYRVVKNPNFMINIEYIAQDPAVRIKQVIIPMRNLTMSAKSRASHGINQAGGLINATDEASQLQFYKHMISNYIFYMCKYNIPTVFIDFDQMVTNKTYLFEKLQSLLDEKKISFDKFSQVYDEVTLSSKP